VQRGQERHAADHAGICPLIKGSRWTRAGHCYRYHLDIETDDLDAETDRLVGLGAAEVNRWLDCRILRAPGGHLLCVIPRHSDDFAQHARTFYARNELVLRIAAP
jgi:hypothetical protein